MTNYNDSISDELIARYLVGDLSSPEYERVSRLIARDPERAQEIELLQKAGEVITLMKPQPDVEAALNVHRQRRSDARLSHHAQATKTGIVKGRSFSLWKGSRVFLPAAAILSLAVGYVIQDRSTSEPYAKDVVEVHSTQRGERASFGLADGTVVVLAPGSKLTISRDFLTRSRDVRLVGGATFEVNSNSGIPFRVSTRNTETVVLGTHFGVMAYGYDSVDRIVVRSGKVSVRPIAEPAVHDGSRSTRLDPVVLGPSHAATVSRRSIYAQQYVDVASELAWEKGRITYTDQTLEYVLASLGNWYAVDFKLDDTKLLGKQITLVLDNKSISEVIDVLQVMLDAVITRQGSVVTIKPDK